MSPCSHNSATKLASALSWVKPGHLDQISLPHIIAGFLCATLEQPIMEILYGAKNGVHAFGYNFAESEPIWMTSGAPWVQILGVIRAVSTVSEAAEILFFFRWITHDFTHFPSDKYYDVWTRQRQSVSPCKLSEQNFENFTVKGRFSKKTQKLLTKFPGFATLGRHNSAMITDRLEFTTKVTLYGMSRFHFYR